MYTGRMCLPVFQRWGARAVYGAGLENRCGFTATGGSNPSPTVFHVVSVGCEADSRAEGRVGRAGGRSTKPAGCRRTTARESPLPFGRASVSAAGDT